MEMKKFCKMRELTTETPTVMHQAGTSLTKEILKCIANTQMYHICHKLMQIYLIMYQKLENKDVVEASWVELQQSWTIFLNFHNLIHKLHLEIARNITQESILLVEPQNAYKRILPLTS